MGGFAAGVIGLGGGIIVVPLLVLIVKVPIQYAIGTALMCVVATSSVQRMNVRVAVLSGAAVAGAFFFYTRGDVRPIVTATALLGDIAGAGIRLWRERMHSSVLRLTVALSWCLFLIGILADAVDPIAFGVIKPEHIPLLPQALIHGSPAAMMHIGILILLVIPVVRIVYSCSRGIA